MSLVYYPTSLIYYPTKNICTNVLLIDSNIKDYLTVVKSCNSNTLPIVYSYSSTTTDLSNVLSTLTTISRIGFFTDSNTKLFIDNDMFFLNTDTSSNYSNNVSFIISIINQYNISCIDYLACNTLNNENWVNYYNILMSVTNVIVGASNNNTGNIQYGGDWITESNSQNIESIYFTEEIQYYKYLLGNNFFNKLIDVTTNFSSITQLTSFPTFNGIANFSTKFRIKNSGVNVDLALLYALNSAPVVANYNTSMYSYVNSTKYDLSALFAPIPVVFSPPTLNGITNYQLNSYTYFISATTTFTVSKNSTCYIFCIGGGGPGCAGNTDNGGGSGSGGAFAKVNFTTGVTYTATIGAVANSGTSYGNNTTFTSSNGSITLTGYGGYGGTTMGAMSGRWGETSGTGIVSAVTYTGGNSGAYGATTPSSGSNGLTLTTSAPVGNTIQIPVSMYNSALTFAPGIGFSAGAAGGTNSSGGKGGSAATGGVGTIAGNNGGAGGYGCGGGGGRKIAGSLGGSGGQGIMYVYVGE